MAADPRPSLLPNAPRTVLVHDMETPPLIRTGLLQSTLLVLPPEERVATVFVGDTASWVTNAGKVASRFVSIKPKIAGSRTDVHVVSDHGNEYTLQLEEISGEADPHFDAKIFLIPGDQKAEENLAQPPQFVPAVEAQAKLDRLQKESDEAKAAAAKERRAAETATEQYQSRYPGTLHFDYVWNQKAAGKLGLEQIWRDGKFTYLRGHFEETPALYEWKDGQGSLINFDYANGLYTVPKTVEQGYLTIGKQRVEFRRAGEEN